MSNVIDMSARMQGKSHMLNYAVKMALARNQKLIIGTSRHQERYNQLKALFPDAHLEIMDLGVAISNGINNKYSR